MLNRKVVILKPLINEKSMNLIKNNFYTFAVAKDATKKDVEKVVIDKFKVDVLSVQMINLSGKTKMQRSRRGFYQTSGTKKAVVKVKNGQKIALFEEFDQEEQTQDVKVTTAEGEEVATTKEKKSLLKGTKVKVEKSTESKDDKETTKKGGKK